MTTAKTAMAIINNTLFRKNLIPVIDATLLLSLYAFSIIFNSWFRKIYVKSRRAAMVAIYFLPSLIRPIQYAGKNTNAGKCNKEAIKVNTMNLIGFFSIIASNAKNNTPIANACFMASNKNG